MAGRKKRNGGCGCGGMCGNPKCRNPRTKAEQNLFLLHRTLTFPVFFSIDEDTAEERVRNLHATASSAEEAMQIAKNSPRNKGLVILRGRPFVSYVQEPMLPHDQKHFARSPVWYVKAQSEDLVGRNPSLNVRNPSRKVHTGSEDYRIGLFQGAMEKGKIPPPHNTSADLRRGYEDGAKVAKAKPTMVAEALGVYKATGNQQQAGAVLYNEVKGESVATLRNPSLNVRNPAAKGYVKIAAFEDKKRKKPTVRDEVYFEAAGPFVRSKHLRAGETLEKVKDDADTITHVPTGMAIYSGVLSRYEDSKKLAVAAMRDLRQWIKKLSKDELRTISEGFTLGSREMTPAQEKLLREAYQVCRSGRIERNPSLNVRNPMSAAARKHLAHEKGEEKAFASMMAALAEGVTVKVGAHRVRKLSKGYVVVDGERLTTAQAARKLHRGK